MAFRLSAIAISALVAIGAFVFQENSPSLREPTTTFAPPVSVVPTIKETLREIIVPSTPATSPDSIPTAVSTPPIIETKNEAVEPHEYIEVVDGCGPYWSGDCLNVRSGPSTEYASVARLRTGVVLAVTESLEVEGKRWYKVGFDEWIRYPERITDNWYVSGDYVRPFFDVGVVEASEITAPSSKRIVVDRSEQKLYAYDGDTIFMEETISTGLDLTPTPRGTFTVFKKTPTRYMQGPLPGLSNDYYDLPGVPWNLYFTEQGGAIHGAYWHDKFGQQWSHGCVNLPLEKARELYAWTPVGTPVTVQD